MPPGEVRLLLEELAMRLDAAGVRAGIRVVGGAALAFLDQGRRATSDVDAVIVPADAAATFVAELGKERGLPDDWLNDAALAYVPLVGPEDWVEVFRHGHVSVSIGSVRMLLAMKLLANRGVRDSDDIGFLLSECGVESVTDAQAIYESYHAQEELSASAAARVQFWLDHRATTGESPFPRIGAPAMRALEQAGIRDLQELTRWSEADLLALHGMGPRAVGLLCARLADEGLAFRS
jgi:hypothetical protein